MIRDTSLIMQMQLAIMGVVLVFGLFYVWRGICRIEEKLDILMMRVQASESIKPMCNVSSSNDIEVINPKEAEEFMKHVFGGDVADSQFMMYMSPEEHDQLHNTKPVVVEEIEEVVQEPEESEADTEATNPLSKSKLKRMNIDTLKELCNERGLPSDGTKAILMNRLLGITRE